MTDQQTPRETQGHEPIADHKPGDAREASAETDAVAPTTDDELHQALEDTFPASDPINFAGSSAGRSPENAENPTPTPPVGTHPLAGAQDRDSLDAASDVGGDARNDSSSR